METGKAMIYATPYDEKGLKDKLNQPYSSYPYSNVNNSKTEMLLINK